MCGLLGTTLLQPLTPDQLAHLRRARDSLIHRGPDFQSDYHDADLYIGHTRLAILDTSADGNQPMYSQDGRLVLAANGEIYNFQELRAQLEGKHHFASNSDSEVLLYGYREWGIDGLLARLEGMFAFSLFDVEKRKLFLARDRIGIKPLYILTSGTTIAWASELKALVSLADRSQHWTPKLTIDYSAVYDYLTYQYVPTPKSLYREIEKLRPGCYLAVDLDKHTQTEHRYWHIDDAINNSSIVQADDITQLLRQSVEQQMIADVPLGFFLSGGIDSTSVVTLAAAFTDDLSTYSIGFDGGNNELPIAAATAARVGSNHTQAVLNEADAQPLIQQMRALFDEPFADTSALPTYLVAELASQRVKVVLTGDGGDEVFSGYTRYAHLADQPLTHVSRPGIRLTARMRSLCPPLRRITRSLERYALLRGFAYYARLLGGLITEEKTEYRQAWEIPADYDDYWHYREHYDATLDVQTALQRLDLLTYLPDDILTKVDRATMAHSLEARVPLLDSQLISAVFALPANQRGSSKQLLKRAMSDLLPQQILERGKTGFSVPSKQWQQGVFDRQQSRAEQLLRNGFAELNLP